MCNWLGQFSALCVFTVLRRHVVELNEPVFIRTRKEVEEGFSVEVFGEFERFVVFVTSCGE